ncbi:unnamed protein product [Protopolystoma xenopodis]|uniref:GIY-YIG domain-containing protein n=1 Tax=Protopolystoma xenopodis TaxID=117903 RepID=A0A3S5B5R1_9PLAT|nr:unnamed protein product [Protopolystoma xenopodis]
MEFWDGDLDKLTGIFLGDGYPNEVIQRNIRPTLSNWNIQVVMKEKSTLFTSLPMQHERVDKLDCSGAYCISYGACDQKYIDETRRKISTRIKEHQRLCRKMDTERSEVAKHIAQTGHEINWKATERRAPYGDNTRKRKIRKAIDTLWEKNLMDRKLEEGRISDNFAYCANKLGENKNRARPKKRRCLDQGSTANRRKRDREE